MTKVYDPLKVNDDLFSDLCNAGLVILFYIWPIGVAIVAAGLFGWWLWQESAEWEGEWEFGRKRR